MPHLLCLGLGFSAKAAARRLAAEGWRITGTAQSADGAASIASAGYGAIRFDGAAPVESLGDAIRAATHVLVCIPPGTAGDPVLAHHAADIASAPALGVIVYLSTIGVYGDAGGGWVDEASPARPQSGRSRARLAAEQAWEELGTGAGKRTCILRLAGIYGPGRSAIDNIKAGTARRIVKPGQVFNRIHVEDVAGAVVAALVRSDAKGVYNVSDDEPAPPQDVMAFAAELMGVAPPPAVDFADAELSPMAASFYAENKRARNTRLKTDLGVALQYPTYREGLAQIRAET